MSRCRCNCGEEAPKGKQFIKGHWSKWNTQEKQKLPTNQNTPKEPENTMGRPDRILIPSSTPEPILKGITPLSNPIAPADPSNTEKEQFQKFKPAIANQELSPPIIPEPKKGKSVYWGYIVVSIIILIFGVIQAGIFIFFKINLWLLLVVYFIDLCIYAFILWTIWRLREKQAIVVFENIEDFIEKVPKWALSESAPNAGIIGKILNIGKQYKQIVLVSKNFEPKRVWSEWNGFQFSIANRGYKPPNGTIRGDIFFYNMDKMTPLIDTDDVTQEDAEDSFQLDAVWNQAFAVGHAAALSKTQGQIQLILILCGCILGALIIYALYSYATFSELDKQIKIIHTIVTNTSQAVQNGR